jgi:hypothetical protein
LNVPGICGLYAGMERVLAEGEEKISAREIGLAQELYSEISKNALSLIKRNFDPKEEIYSVTVRAEKLSRLNECTLQQKLFPEPWEANYEKRHSLEITLDKIRSRYGNRSIGLASAINNRLI